MAHEEVILFALSRKVEFTLQGVQEEILRQTVPQFEHWSFCYGFADATRQQKKVLSNVGIESLWGGL